MSVEPRRFPAPWTAEETDACFIARLAYAESQVDLGAGLSRRADTTSRGLRAATAGFLSLDI